MSNESICEWVKDKDGVYWTGCAQAFEFENGSDVSGNSFKFCPFCGCEIKDKGDEEK